MKKNVFLCHGLLAFVCLCLFMLGACSDRSVVDGFEDIPSVKEEFHEATLVAKLSGEDLGSRLAHESGMYGSKAAILTKWEADDKVVINFSPGDKTTKCYPFELTDGAGTSYGVFTHATMPNYSSKQWIMYFPGNSIQCEKDFLAHSYEGQTQNGNGNLEHLKNYHSIRYVRNFDVETTFTNEIIDFSGEGFDESFCIKFQLKNLPSIVPVKMELAYINSGGAFEDIFYTHNYLTSYFSDSEKTYSPNAHKVSHMALNLTNFATTTTVTAYMMMGNYPVTVGSGGKFRVLVTASTGIKYYSDININADATLEGGNLYGINCNVWTEAEMIDGFENPEEGVVVLQKATKGTTGADIIIMGDGFANDKFGAGNEYETIMINAYQDFFSIEPLYSLQDYFNVYYIKAVSKNNHDATPYWSGGDVGSGSQNGATQGSANTVFKTLFTPGQTTIDGNNTMALQYAMQAIRSKGSSTGGVVSDEEEVYRRAHTALIMVMVNVECHAGTCHSVIVEDPSFDYGNAYSVAYTALGHDGTGAQCKWTTIHEAAGHGFGKLADEYGGYSYNTFNTSAWGQLSSYHSYGYYRNVNEYWNATAESKWASVVGSKEETTTSNVYWSPLINGTYNAELSNDNKGEGLGVYRGGYTFDELYCRPTANSVMNNQFATNGQFFNAISRWAIWYRLMRLTGTGSYSEFSSSLSGFTSFDKAVPKNQSVDSRGVLRPQDLKPLPPPVVKMGRWVNGRLVIE